VPAAAIPVLRRKLPATGCFRLPGGTLIPLAATVVGLGLLASASCINLLGGAVAAAVGGVIYAPRNRDDDAKGTGRRTGGAVGLGLFSSPPAPIM